MRLLHFTPAFAVIAGGTGCHQIRPDMSAAHVPRDDVVDGQAAFVFTAILAGIIVAPEDFAAR